MARIRGRGIGRWRESAGQKLMRVALFVDLPFWRLLSAEGGGNQGNIKSEVFRLCAGRDSSVLCVACLSRAHDTTLPRGE